jgi:hypothetical protein
VRRAAVLVAGIGVAIALAGGGSGSSSAQAAVRHAFARTVDAGSSRFVLSWAIPEFETALTSDYKVDGLMDYVHHRGQISFGSQAETLIDADVTYSKTALPWRHDAVWVHSDTSGQESDPFDLQERAMNNPLSLLTFLTGVGSDVRNMGTERVRDAETTHYEGTLNLQNVIANAPQEERADLKDTLDFIGQFEPTSVPFGLWVDRDGVARRLRIDQKDSGSILIEYYDFGVPVSITPPPANATITIEELFKEVDDHQTDSNCNKDDSSTDSSTYNDQMVLPEHSEAGSGETNAEEFMPSSGAVYFVCSTIGGG